METGNRKLEIALSTEQIGRIEAKHLVEGKAPSIEAELQRAEYNAPKSRHYKLDIGNWKSEIRAQLNHGDPAADALRLAEIATDLLSKEDTEIHEPAALHRS